MAFKDYEGRREAAKKITEESKKIEKLFRKLATATLEPEKKCSVLPTLAEVIKLKDTSMLPLEITVCLNELILHISKFLAQDNDFPAF